jgi:hypothetical protein
MSINRPLIRTVRQLVDGSYTHSGNGNYILHTKYAKDPQHYTRSFDIIQNDLLKLFEYIEPSDQNLNCISLKINELLIRTCIEIEANFTAILKENNYCKSGNWNIKNDYYKIGYTHYLDQYEVRFPVWRGDNKIRSPYKKWGNKTKSNWYSLDWYQAYNKAKHERYEFFPRATFEVLLDAISALVILLSSQFLDESFSTTEKGMGIGESYSYDYDPNFRTAIGSYFTIKYPSEIPEEDKYDFTWQVLKTQENPFDFIDYNSISCTF